MNTDQTIKQVEPLVSGLLVKDSGSTWLFQGLEAIFVGILILTVVFGVIFILRKKLSHNIDVDRRSKYLIDVVYAKKISRKSHAMVINWQGSEYLVLENNQQLTVVDKNVITNACDSANNTQENNS
ncbi:MAG: hypothetical protein RPR28_10140 [Cycloclasticus sp.]|jgi:hypothetical protein